MAEPQECHEGITDREGYFVPCEKRAVGYRLDPEEGRPYPVCKKHLRADIFVPSYNAVLDDWQERNPPAAPNLATHASERAQVGTTGRLDAKTAQTGAQHTNERKK